MKIESKISAIIRESRNPRLNLQESSSLLLGFQQSYTKLYGGRLLLFFILLLCYGSDGGEPVSFKGFGGSVREAFTLKHMLCHRSAEPGGGV